MTTPHVVTLKTTPNHCEPSHPAPVDHVDETCEAEVTLSGKLHGLTCCCPHLVTRTFAIDVGPRTEAQLRAFNQGTANAWEAAGYLIQAHSLIDTGAGWMLLLTVGWYTL